jgi:hypothetical protein
VGILVLTARRAGIWLAAAMVLAPYPAAAQSAFVSAGVFGDIQRFGHPSIQSPQAADQDPSGTAPGVQLAAGGDLATRVGVQVELAISKPIRHEFESPLARTELDYRSRRGAILVGYLTNGRGRMRTAILGGMVILEQRFRRADTLIGGRSSSVFAPTSIHVAPTLGLDVIVATTAKLAVVPQLRAYKLTTSVSTEPNAGTLAIAPGVALRWMF